MKSHHAPLSAVLLFALAGTASAQQAGTVAIEQPDGSIKMVPVISTVNRAFSQPEGFGPRSETMVLDNLTGAFSNATRQLLGCNHLVDDFLFTPGPWAESTQRVASSWSWTFFVGRWDGTASPAFNFRLKVYNARAFATTVGQSMIPADATVAGNIVYRFPQGVFNSDRPDAGYVINFIFPDNPLKTTPGEEDLKFSGTSAMIEASIEDPNDPKRLAWYPSIPLTNPLGNAAAYIPPGENTTAPVQLFGLMMMNKPTSPGSANSIYYGRDINGDGLLAAGINNDRETRSNAGRSLGISIKGFVCPCVADYDGSGGTPDVNDIDTFFTAWLAGDPTADTNCSGGAPDASDIDEFFRQWLAGGC
jgi:hypothetical protein